jgi:LmbE family N-acetylglucosaminyl deacetylase
MKAQLVVVGAHPMDAEILGGALAARLARSNCTSVLVHLTNGARSYPHLAPSASADVSEQEACAASQILGTRHHWCDFDSSSLHARGRFRDALAELMMEWQPEVVITHWRGSWHQRHSIAHRLVVNALATARTSPTLYYGENFEDLAGFTPRFYVDISKVCTVWWQALECYGLVRASRAIQPEDVSTFPYHAYYRAAPRVRGLESGVPLAQALATGGSRPQTPVLIDNLLEHGKGEA